MGEKITVSSKRRKIRISYIIILLLLLTAGCIIFYRIHNKNKLRSKIEAMRAAGYLLTLEELNQINSIPSGSENAADLILDAMYDFYKEPNNADIEKLLSDSNNDIPVHTKPYPEETVTLMGQFLKDNENALKMLHKASALQYSRYPRELEDPNRPGKGLLILVTDGIKLLNIEALYFSETYDSESVLRSIKPSFNIADSFAKEPMLLFHAIRMYYNSRNISILTHIINRVNFTDEQLIDLEKSISDALDFSNLPNVFAGEMSRTFDALNNDDNINIDIIPENVPLAIAQFQMFFYKHLGIVDTDRILYLDYMRRYIEAGKLPFQERYNTIKKIEEEIKNLPKIHLLTGGLSGFSRGVDTDKKYISKIQVTKAAIAVKRYYLANGLLPDTLNDLIPAYLDEVPVTPDGKGLKYRKINEGCIIYSEGNKKNNINKAPPQSDLINHGIPNLGEWFVIEFEKGVSQ